MALRHVPPEEARRLIQGNERFSRYYHYEIRPVPCGGKAAFAIRENVPIASLRGSHKPYAYWRALRNSLPGFKACSPYHFSGDFGLDTVIDSPHHTPLINLANPMKPPFGGVIYALHRMPAGVDKLELVLLAARLGCPVEMLMDDRFGFLGEEQFVRPYRSNVFWNPQDHRCKDARLAIRYGMPIWQMSGKLYKSRELFPTEKGADS